MPFVAYNRPRDPFISNVVFLSHLDDTSYIDVTGRHTLNISPGATLVPGLFGSAASFSGGNVGLGYSSNSDFNFGTGNFTIEFTVNFSGLGSSQQLVCCHAAFSAVSWTIETDTGGIIRLYNSDSGSYIIVNSVGTTINTTTSYALVRSGNNLYIYKDGIRTQTATSGATVGSGAAGLPFGVGGPGNAVTYGMTGWIDEVRVTKGIARYTDSTYTLSPTVFPYP